MMSTPQDELATIKARFVAAMSAKGSHAATAMCKLTLLQQLVGLFGQDRGGQLFEECLRASGLWGK